MPEPLETNSKRQAIDPLKGYSYQIWQSVLRWIELDFDRYLFLEGAEDIDLHGPGQVETIQIKDTFNSGTVTLRSKDVIESINNYWDHYLENPQVSIVFRFLTTSEGGLDFRASDHWIGKTLF